MQKHSKTQEKQKFKERGITLIALIITIIVILILAGVTLSSLFGDSGLITQAENVKEQTEKSKEKEGLQLAVTACYVNKHDSMTIEKDSLESAIKEQFGNYTNFTLSVNAEEGFTVTFNESNRDYQISESGNITILEKVTDTTPREFCW